MPLSDKVIDCSKLKVVELRAELAKRGLDTKGNKPFLVSRLQAALEDEARATEKEPKEEKEEEEETSSKDEEDSSNHPVAEFVDKQEDIVNTSDRVEESVLSSTAEDSTMQAEEASSHSVLVDETSSEVPLAQDVCSSSNPPESLDASDQSEIKSVFEPPSIHLEDSNAQDAIVTGVSNDEETTAKSPDVEKEVHEELKSEEVQSDSNRIQSEEEFRLQEKVDDDSGLKIDEENEEHAEKVESAEHAAEKVEDAEHAGNVENTEQAENVENEERAENTENDERAENTENEEREENAENEERAEKVESAEKRKYEPDDSEEKSEEPPAKMMRTEERRIDRVREDDYREERTAYEERREVVEDEPEFDETAVLLSWYDSDLHIRINKETLTSATVLNNSPGFGYVWAGVRATYGFMSGRVFFEMKVTENVTVSGLEDEPDPYVIRVGWSANGTSLQLGEEAFSYGYGGTGKFSCNCEFTDYGMKFEWNDVVGCYLNLEADPIEISFAVNGEHQGVACKIPKDELGDRALFPHFLSKNCGFEVNFGQVDPWFRPEEEFCYVGQVPVEDRVAGLSRPAKREDCEVIMMVGLPGAGKSTWAEKHAKEHPEKNFNILGTNTLIDKMKVMGLPRKRNYRGRWESLIQKCTQCLNKLLDVAGKRRRNVIIDQTNVYASAARKVAPFVGFRRRAVVLVPPDEELKRRNANRQDEEGKDIPEKVMLDMKANFDLPILGKPFDDIEYVELPESEAVELVKQYNKEGKDAGFVKQSERSRRRENNNDWSNRHKFGSSKSFYHHDSSHSRDRGDRRGGWGDRSYRGAPNANWRDQRGYYGGYNRNWSNDRSNWRGAPYQGNWREQSRGSGGDYGGNWRDRGRRDDRSSDSRDSRYSSPSSNKSRPQSQQSSSQSSSTWGGGDTSKQTTAQYNAAGNSQQQTTSQQGSWAGYGNQWTSWPAYGSSQQQQQWKGYQGGYQQWGQGGGNYSNWNQYYNYQQNAYPGYAAGQWTGYNYQGQSTAQVPGQSAQPKKS